MGECWCVWAYRETPTPKEASRAIFLFKDGPKSANDLRLVRDIESVIARLFTCGLLEAELVGNRLDEMTRYRLPTGDPTLTRIGPTAPK